MSGPAALTPLPWDTEFFGIRIARAEAGDSLDPTAAAARDAGIECLYLTVREARPGALDAAIRAGALLTDLRLELERDAPPPEAVEGVRVAAEADTGEVERLAAELSAYSRFNADPRFPAGRIAEMYRLWAHRCLAEGTVVLPAEGAGGMVGTRPGDPASVDLVYVAPGAAGGGLGRRLVEAALAEVGGARATVATSAANIPAVRLYESLGFRAARLSAVLHLWLDG
jgi:GNAT superfamily N-acetyltransferase